MCHLGAGAGCLGGQGTPVSRCPGTQGVPHGRICMVNTVDTGCLYLNMMNNVDKGCLYLDFANT